MGFFLAADIYYVPFLGVVVTMLVISPIFWSLPAIPEGDDAMVIPAAAGAAVSPGADDAPITAVKPTQDSPSKRMRAPSSSNLRRGSSLLIASELAGALVPENFVVKLPSTEDENFFVRVLSLVSNKIWILTTLGSVTETFVVGAYSSFGPQFMEKLFSVPRSIAPIIAGVISKLARKH
jgi:hypothetical protein